VHLCKNFMKLPNIKVPLILGIWGGKGQGNVFQVSVHRSYNGSCFLPCGLHTVRAASDCVVCTQYKPHSTYQTNVG